MRTHSRLLVVALIAGACLIAAGPAVHGQTNRRTHDVYVTVTDKAGAPATDLTPADFTIREDNRDREVLAVGTAKTPMRIALLIDNSQITQSVTNELRIAMSGFIQAMFKANPDNVMSLSTFGDRPTLVEGFTSSPQPLVRAAQKLFPMNGAGAYLTDAIMDAAQSLRKEPMARQVIVAFIDESGEEFSNAGRSQVLDALRFSNAQLWVVALQGAATNMNSQEARDRSAVIDEGTSQTGGTTLPLLNRLSLPQRMTELAALLNSQIQITYGRPEQTVPPKKIEIQLSRKGLKLQAPRWAGQ